MVACHLLIFGSLHKVKTSTLKIIVWENPEAQIHKQGSNTLMLKFKIKPTIQLCDISTLVNT